MSKPPSQGELPLPSLLDAVKSAREPSWVRRTADELLEEFDGSPADQAAELERKAEAYEDGAEAAMALAEEMRRRGRAGIRFWPGSKPAERNRFGREERTLEGRQAPAPDDVVDPPAPDDFT